MPLIYLQLLMEFIPTFMLDFICFSALFVLLKGFKEKLELEQLKNFEKQDKTLTYNFPAVLICSIILFVGVMLKFSMLIILISVAGLYPLLSKFFKKRAVTKLQEEFDKSLGESLQILTSSLRAGLTLKAALTASIKSAPKVFADQMRITINDFNLGVPMDEALTRMKSRVNTPTTDLALGSMIITSRSGGDLASMLGKISLSINESERIQGKLRALTAQGKMQALLVSLAPPFLFIFMSFYDPERMNVLTETTMGQILLVTAVIFEVIGIIITKKVLKLKI